MNLPFLELFETEATKAELIESDSVIIGCTNRDFSSRSRTIPAGSFSRDDMFGRYTHENLRLDDDFNWRYRPDTRTLYWWTPPVDEEYTTAVIAYIRKKTGSEPLRQKNVESELSLAHGLKNPVKESVAESLLAEMPVGKFELLGDWSPGAKPRGYDKPSIGIVTSQASVEKIRQKWAKVNETFDIYLVRSPKGYKQVEVGEVSPEWVQKKLGINLEYDDNKVTMIYTNNKGSEKVPMTPWTLAHRFGHASSRMFKDSSYTKDESNPIMYFTRQLDSSLTKIAQVVYGQLRGYDGYYSRPENYPRKEVIFRQICQNLGTMKSCRDGNLRNWGEFAFEVLAQYMITGKVSLSRNLKSVLPTRFVWGKPQGPWKRSMSPEQQIAVEGIIDDLEMEAENYAFETLKRAIGRIYVM